MREQLKKLFKLVRILALILFLIIIVIIFIIIPISISISKYYQSEAPSCLSSIVTAEISNYIMDDSWSDSFKQIGWAPYGPGRYSYFLTPTEYVGESPEELGIPMPVNFKAYGAPIPGLSENGFIAVAIGNIDSDDNLDVWWIDQNKTPLNSHDDVNNFKVIIEDIRNEVTAKFLAD